MITLHFTVSNYSENYSELSLCAARGYLGGMDANNRYFAEGTEALGLLGLQVLPDTDLVD